MSKENEAVIVAAARTPMGKKNGSFAETRADELASTVLSALVERSGVDPHDIDDVVTGCVTQTDEQGLNIGRNIPLAAGLPIEVTGTSVNRLCGSGLQAMNFGVMGVASGFQKLVACLGAESMSRVPMGSDGGAINPQLLDRFAIIPQGLSAELMVQKWELTREELDGFSLASHTKALAAIDAGKFTREIVPTKARRNGGFVTVAQDETPRRGTSLAKLAKLSPAFKPDGAITAGNSSQITDGAAGVLVTTRAEAEKRGLTPRARIVAMATAGVDPTIMLTGPAPASKKALAQAGLSIGDIDVIECNEAFAPVPIIFAREMGIDVERLNPRGNAIALGHPLGATGVRLITTLLHTLEDEQKRYGLATLCIGFGQGIATIIERLG